VTPPALVLVVAMTKNRVIGRAGSIPWDLLEDRRHFVNVTRGHALIMGRLTFESIGKPLPKRRNIVVSRQVGLELPGAELAGSLQEAIALARTSDAAPRVIGGGQLYREALPLATQIYLTELERELEGDTWFPELDPADWEVRERRSGEGASYVTLERRTAAGFRTDP